MPGDADKDHEINDGTVAAAGTERRPSTRSPRARWLGAAAASGGALLVVAAIWFIAPLAVDAQPGSRGPVTGGATSSGSAAVLAGPGIDPTGRTVSTEGVRDFIANLPPDGVRVIEVPSGAVLRLDGTIEIPGNTIVRGGGELRWTEGIANAAALSVTGENVEISGVTLTNPNELGAADGERNYGIEIKASDVRIIANHIELFQNGIAVRFGGEFHDIVISGNRVKDVVGAGGGPESDENLGEDRGDGIVVWGAQATVTGNVVNAKPGTDARVGIHTESTTLENAQDAPHSASMVTITGNVVYGQFRRSIVSENVAHTTITGNTVADATWWSIAVILQSHDSVVSGNTILYTRTDDDEQGRNYDPRRAPIMVYGGVQRVQITDNSILVAEGASARAFVVAQGEGEQVPRSVTVDGNTATVEGGSVVDGVAAVGRTEGLRVTDNRLTGFTGSGVAIGGGRDFVVDRNHLTGAAAEYGVRAADSEGWGQVSDNIFSGVAANLEAPGPSKPATTWRIEPAGRARGTRARPSGAHDEDPG